MPIQEEERACRNQHWNRHQQVVGTLFRWDRENGTTLKYKDPRNLTSRCQSSWLKYFDTRKLVEKKMPEFLMIEFVDECKKVLSDDSRYWSDEVRNKLKMAPHWSADKWIDVLANGGGQKKRFQYCLTPNYPEKLLYLRAIQGHSGKALSGNTRIHPALQDNVLLPKDFTKCIYHVGNGKELGSTVRNDLVPRGFSTGTGAQEG